MSFCRKHFTMRFSVRSRQHYFCISVLLQFNYEFLYDGLRSIVSRYTCTHCNWKETNDSNFADARFVIPCVFVFFLEFWGNNFENTKKGRISLLAKLCQDSSNTVFCVKHRKKKTLSFQWRGVSQTTRIQNDCDIRNEPLAEMKKNIDRETEGEDCH